MPFESKLAVWGAIYARLTAAQARQRVALEADDGALSEACRAEIAELRAASDRCIMEMDAILEAWRLGKMH